MTVMRRQWFDGKNVLVSACLCWRLMLIFLQDIGCNAGYLTISIAERFSVKSIAGIDIDPHLIARARKLLAQRAGARARLLQAALPTEAPAATVQSAASASVGVTAAVAVSSITPPSTQGLSAPSTAPNSLLQSSVGNEHALVRAAEPTASEPAAQPAIELIPAYPQQFWQQMHSAAQHGKPVPAVDPPGTFYVRRRAVVDSGVDHVLSSSRLPPYLRLSPAEIERFSQEQRVPAQVEPPAPVALQTHAPPAQAFPLSCRQEHHSRSFGDPSSLPACVKRMCCATMSLTHFFLQREPQRA